MTTSASSPAPPCGLYEAVVRHERRRPRSHQFTYRLFYFCLDLDRLIETHKRLALFSVNRANVFSFHEADFGPPGGSGSLKERVISWCDAHGLRFPNGSKILLVTLPRLFGHRFNPVSFYFCFDGGKPVCAVAEVTNTFREVKLYLLERVERSGGVRFVARTPKYFYVSPYSPVDLTFDFELALPGERLAVRIDTEYPEGKAVHATVAGERRALTNRRLVWYLLKYPLVTLKVIAMIHWEAFRLWAKGVPHFRKGDRLADQTGFARPRPSPAPPPPIRPAPPQFYPP